MDNDILCPTCGHSLAFHKFDYGSCEAPLGGLTSKNMCGCPFTVHTYIQNLQAKDSAKELEQLEIKYRKHMEEFEKLQNRHDKGIDEIVNSLVVLKLAQKRIEFLDLKLRTIRELLDKINSIEKVFGIGYRNEVVKIVNEIILELEKDMDK